MAEKQVGPFILGKKLGAGGMGVVYLATYTKTGQEVAVKILPPDQAVNEKSLARFERELEILKKLSHPHIVRCFGGGRANKQYFYAMELVTGGTVADLLEQRGKLGWDQVVDLGIEVCDALAYAHIEGIVHRDLKPSNLLITKKGKIKLSDFGIARDNNAATLTATGRTVGTFNYMSPEQISGQYSISHKSDLYSLGCLLFELLTGEPPFHNETAARVLHGHMQQKPAKPSTISTDCPIWLDALIAQLLEKDPDKRPLDAAVVARGLLEVKDKVARGQTAAAHAVSGAPTALTMDGDATQARALLKPKKKRRRDSGPIYQRTWFLSLCLLLLIGGVAYSLWPPGEELLYARAFEAMKSQEPTDWDAANKKYIQPLLTRFPNGKHATEAQAFVDQIEMHKAEDGLKYLKFRKPNSEAERLFVNAQQYEDFGDRISALEHYQSLVELLQNDRASRPFVNLARRQIKRIEADGGAKEDRTKFVADALSRADALNQKGEAVQARIIWQSLITLYKSNKELEQQVLFAQEQLAPKK